MRFLAGNIVLARKGPYTTPSNHKIADAGEHTHDRWQIPREFTGAQCQQLIERFVLTDERKNKLNLNQIQLTMNVADSKVRQNDTS